MNSNDISYIREKTGVGIHDILKISNEYPKANKNEIIEILEYIGFAVYHKIPVKVKFSHLRGDNNGKIL